MKRSAVVVVVVVVVVEVVVIGEVVAEQSVINSRSSSRSSSSSSSSISSSSSSSSSRMLQGLLYNLMVARCTPINSKAVQSYSNILHPSVSQYHSHQLAPLSLISHSQQAGNSPHTRTDC